jgi:hypothetical protein
VVVQNYPRFLIDISGNGVQLKQPNSLDVISGEFRVGRIIGLPVSLLPSQYVFCSNSTSVSGYVVWIPDAPSPSNGYGSIFGRALIVPDDVRVYQNNVDAECRFSGSFGRDLRLKGWDLSQLAEVNWTDWSGNFQNHHVLVSGVQSLGVLIDDLVRVRFLSNSPVAESERSDDSIYTYSRARGFLSILSESEVNQYRSIGFEPKSLDFLFTDVAQGLNCPQTNF